MPRLSRFLTQHGRTICETSIAFTRDADPIRGMDADPIPGMDTNFRTN